MRAQGKLSRICSTCSKIDVSVIIQALLYVCLELVIPTSKREASRANHEVAHEVQVAEVNECLCLDAYIGYVERACAPACLPLVVFSTVLQCYSGSHIVHVNFSLFHQNKQDRGRVLYIYTVVSRSSVLMWEDQNHDIISASGKVP